MTRTKPKRDPVDVERVLGTVNRMGLLPLNLPAQKQASEAGKKVKIRRTAAKRQETEVGTAQSDAPIRAAAAESDLEVDALRSGLERSSKQISALMHDGRRLEATAKAREREIAVLRLSVTRLKDEKVQLDRRIGELVRNNEALRIADGQKKARIGSLVRSTNRLNNELFWSICHFIAGSDDFAAFAKSVDYDRTRLFTMLLAAEIREASDLSPDIQGHAAAISNIFDPFFYLTEYQDVALGGVNPLLHYVTTGYREHRNPSRLFDPRYYAGQAHIAKVEPLLHYVRKGAAAGLKPHALFDTAFYLERNPDIAKSDINPLFHYQTWGGRERRDPSPLFDTEYYLETRNLGPVLENPLQDYLIDDSERSIDPHPLFHSTYFSRQAGVIDTLEAPLVIYVKRADLHRTIKPHPLFDLNFMQSRLGIEFPEGIPPIEWFCRISRKRDIDPSLLFDSRLYRYQIEVERGGTLAEPPIIDYLKRGHKDKTLRPNIVFDPESYLQRNRIEVAGPELIHYCLFGDSAGYETHQLFSAAVYNAARADESISSTALEHFLGSESDQRHVSHLRAGRPLLPDVLELVRRVYSDDSGFDTEFYRQIYPDLAGLDESEAKIHYETNGKAEGRVGSPREFIQRFKISVRDIPLGFFPDEYVHFNPDLSGLSDRFIPLFGHYIMHGRNENRTIGRWQFHFGDLDLAIPTPAKPIIIAEAERIDVGVLMHIFYPDLWPELAGFVRNFEAVSSDVFVNVVDTAWTPMFQRELRELCPGAFVQLSNNSGRDIGGIVRLLDSIDITKYDLFAWMQTKKSPHIAPEQGEYWRRSLLKAFAGSKEIVADCVQLFRDDPSVGLVAAAEWRSTHMGNNQEQYERALDLFQIDERHRDLEYVSGTMCLIRSEILQQLYQKLKDVEWENVNDKIDGQIAHAAERIIGNLVRQMGYRMIWR